MTIQKQIITFVEKNSSQQFEDGAEDDKILDFTTREHGDVGEEQHSQIDFDDAQQVIIKTMGEFNHLIKSYEIETCDEWVNLVIIIK